MRAGPKHGLARGYGAIEGGNEKRCGRGGAFLRIRVLRCVVRWVLPTAVD